MSCPPVSLSYYNMASRWPLWAVPGASEWRKLQRASPFILTGRSKPPFLRASSRLVHITCLSRTTASLLDSRVVSNSLSASSNLTALCGFVILMQKSGHLPPDTASVLSQVSFNLVIPCFLMSKVSSTISMHQDWKFLSLPLMALFQITVGGILGRLAGIIMYGHSSAFSSKGQNDGYSTAKVLLTAACTFGNTVTLPLVFLNGMLSQADYSTAAGYLALYMMGWSPCLWTLGYQVLSSTSGSSRPVTSDWSLSFNNLGSQWKRIMNPPLYGVLLGILIGATPLSYLFLPSKQKLLLLSINQANNPFFSLYSMMASILQPIAEGARLLGSATVPLQTIVLASSLASSISREDKNMEKPVARKNDTAASTLEMSTRNIVLDGKVFWASAIIRLLIMPCISLTILTFIQHKGWLPIDPLSRLVLLVVSAMPTAQNLVVLAQINPTTRPFAGVLANILVRQYLVAVVSLTLWIPIFFTFLQL